MGEVFLLIHTYTKSGHIINLIITVLKLMLFWNVAIPNALADAPSEKPPLRPHRPANQFHNGILRVFN